VTKTAEHLAWPEVKVQAALNSVAAFPEKIAAALADNDWGFEELKRMLPGIILVEVPYPAEDGEIVEVEQREAMP
jgi:hypothetical protein